MLNILKKLGIKVSENDGYLEHLVEKFPERIFYFDELPFTISDEYSDKYFQYEPNLCFLIAKNKRQKEKFLATENKYLNIMTKLWLYNKVYAGAEFGLYKVNKYISYRNKKLITKFDQSELVEVTDIQEFEDLVRLGAKSIINAEFYLEEYGMIILPSMTVFIIYFHDLSKLDIVKSIVNTGGLFLRPYPDDEQ